eukprot:PhF_6_TR33580/c0_g1_i1/m.49002
MNQHPPIVVARAKPQVSTPLRNVDSHLNRRVPFNHVQHLVNIGNANNRVVSSWLNDIRRTDHPTSTTGATATPTKRTTRPGWNSDPRVIAGSSSSRSNSVGQPPQQQLQQRTNSSTPKMKSSQSNRTEIAAASTTPRYHDAHQMFNQRVYGISPPEHHHHHQQYQQSLQHTRSPPRAKPFYDTQPPGTSSPSYYPHDAFNSQHLGWSNGMSPIIGPPPTKEDVTPPSSTTSESEGKDSAVKPSTRSDPARRKALRCNRQQQRRQPPPPPQSRHETAQPGFAPPTTGCPFDNDYNTTSSVVYPQAHQLDPFGCTIETHPSRSPPSLLMTTSSPRRGGDLSGLSALEEMRFAIQNAIGQDPALTLY